MKTLHIITPCSRFDMLPGLAQNVAQCVQATPPSQYTVRWHVAFQHPLQPDLVGAVKNNEILRMIHADDFVWILDDDNLVHPRFFTTLDDVMKIFPDHNAFVFSQNRRDELGPVLKAAPENMKLYKVDTAQVVFKKKLMWGLEFPEDTRTPDGILFEDMYGMAQAAGEEDLFRFVDVAVVNYNWRKDGTHEG